MRAPGIRSIPGLLQPKDQQADYAAIIRDGLPATDAPKDVAVIGAGIAGLVSASLLAAAGHRVRIYEASERVGGRIFTVRAPFGEGLYAEAGAMRLPSFYKLTLDYIAKFGLPTNTFYNHDPNGNEYIFVNGVKVRRSEYKAQQGRGLGYPLLPTEEGVLAEDLLNNALAQISAYVGADPLEDYEHNRWNEVVKRFGEYTVREFLKGQTFYSEGAIEMIEVLLDLESRSDQSLLQQIVEINDHGPSVDYVEITGGMDQLPQAFLPLLEQAGVPIALDRRLTSIAQADGKVTLRFEPGVLPEIVKGSAIAPHEVTADHAILTVPFPGMRYIKVDPPLSHEKRKAIRELHYDASTKILLEFKSRFWELQDGIYGGSTVTDLPSRFLYYPSHGRGLPGGVIISSYTWGDEARGWDALCEAHQIRCALDDVAAIHGEGIRAEFVRGFVQSWATNRFSYGEAAMFYGGQLSELQAYIPTPEGNLHFAGEHTSLKHAWIEGAVESGIRAALEIN